MRSPPQGIERAGALVEQEVGADLVGVLARRSTARPRRRRSPRRRRTTTSRSPCRCAALARPGAARRRPRSAVCCFMSWAPRPQTKPSAMSPDHGSCVQSRPGWRSTVSTWESRHSVGPSPVPRSRATRLGRSWRAAEQLDLEARRPRAAPARCSWALRSSPGGLTVLKRIRSCSSATGSAMPLRLRRRPPPPVARPATITHPGDRAHELVLGEAAGQAARRGSRPGPRRRRRPRRRPSRARLTAGGRPRRRSRRRSPTARLVPAACAGASPTRRISAGTRSEPRIRPDDAAEEADHGAGPAAARRSSRSRASVAERLPAEQLQPLTTRTTAMSRAAGRAAASR